MKSLGTDWTKLKAELGRLTDVDFLKSENLHRHLRDARKRLLELQREIDRGLDRVIALIRKKTKPRRAAAKKAAKPRAKAKTKKNVAKKR